MSVAAVIVNPVNVRLDGLGSVVEAAETGHGWDRSVWFETTAADPGQGAANRALAMSPDVVIVVGGDGTVRAVAAVMLRSMVPLTIVPTGTGNLLARNLRIPLDDLGRSVAAAFDGSDHVIDTVSATVDHESGETSEHMFLAMAGVGLDAAMAQRSNVGLKAVLGWLAYVPPIARSVLSNRSFTLAPNTSSQQHNSVCAHTMIVGNCGVLTGDIVLLPAAVVDDGLFDVVILRPGRLIGWTPIGLRLVANGIVYRRRQGRGKTPRRLPSSRTAHHRQTRQFEATFDQPQLLELDGDVIGHVTQARFQLLPATLRIRTTTPA